MRGGRDWAEEPKKEGYAIDGESKPAESDGGLTRAQRRARLLRELSEARELLERVAPRRAAVARRRLQWRWNTFRR